MTDLLDYVLSDNQTFKNKSYLDSKQAKSEHNRQKISEKKIRANKFKISNEINCYKFIEIDEVSTILLNIQQNNGTLRLIFKLLQINEIFKIKNNFLKSYLIKEFFNNRNSVLQPNINPLTGEIVLQYCLIMREKNQKQKDSEIQNIINKIKLSYNVIIDFWKNIISISKGNFSFGNTFHIREKFDDLKKFSIFSKKSKQFESFYNSKNQDSKENITPDNFIESLKTHFTHQKTEKSQENWQYRKKLQKILREKKVLEQNCITNAQAILNFQHFAANDKEKIQIFENLKKLNPSQQLKVIDKKLGKLFLTHSGYLPEYTEKITQILDSLDKSVQLRFLDYFFHFKHEHKKVLLKVALKKMSLRDYLEKNNKVICLESKLRIFIQIFYAVQVLWQRFDIFTGSLNILDIDITKSMAIKISNIDRWVPMGSYQSRLTELDSYIFKNQTMIKLLKIFYGMFYHKQLYFARPSRKLSTRKSRQNGKIFSFIEDNIDEIQNNAHLYGVPEILKSITYCFKKYESSEIPKQSLLNSQLDVNQMIELKYKMKEGNFDFILGTLTKSLELLSHLNIS